jgi:hypothetical protein
MGSDPIHRSGKIGKREPIGSNRQHRNESRFLSLSSAASVSSVSSVRASLAPFQYRSNFLLRFENDFHRAVMGSDPIHCFGKIGKREPMSHDRLHRQHSLFQHGYRHRVTIRT